MGKEWPFRQVSSSTSSLAKGPQQVDPLLDLWWRWKKSICGSSGSRAVEWGGGGGALCEENQKISSNRNTKKERRNIFLVVASLAGPTSSQVSELRLYKRKRFKTAFDLEGIFLVFILMMVEKTITGRIINHFGKEHEQICFFICGNIYRFGHFKDKSK